MDAFLLRLRRSALYLALTLSLMPVQAILLVVSPRLARRLPLAYHRLNSRLLGFVIERVGTPAAPGPVLFVANHISYIDIEILGASIEGSFIAKAEVKGWPLLGWLARLQRTVFVERSRRHRAHAQRDAIAERLAAGDNLILFPEGTSGDGNRVLPFKTALFAAADHQHAGVPVVVQPVTIAYVRLDGIPIGRAYRPFFAWYGAMSLAPHLWTMLGLGTVDVTVIFHRPVTLPELGSRKALAAHCRRVIADGLAAALSGRLPPPPAAPDPAEGDVPAGAEAGGLA